MHRRSSGRSHRVWPLTCLCLFVLVGSAGTGDTKGYTFKPGEYLVAQGGPTLDSFEDDRLTISGWFNVTTMAGTTRYTLLAKPGSF